MSLMSLSSLTVRRGQCPVVDHVDLAVEKGEFVGLLGPNGAGKTSLLRAALGLLPHEGRSSLSALAPAVRARTVAFLPQGREIAWPVTVADLVALAEGGAEAQARAIARMGLENYQTRRATELARALAQDAPLLLADEPAAGLDPEAQIRTMQVFRDLAEEGRGVVASIHDLGLAARHCTRLVLLHRGRKVADGAPRDVLSPENLAEVFGVRGFHAETEDGPVFQPLGVIR
ncbi:MAG: ABC transporter ATP-binding protein [Cypionkella sp.]|nr:ABC transporter ATP-binding protein [Cypionkella sp.]